MIEFFGFKLKIVRYVVDNWDGTHYVAEKLVLIWEWLK
jgi:hypothetical protein